MGEKKDRERFCIKFNARDSVHKKAMEILEKQSPRGKAQFIANAVVWYGSKFEMSDISQIQLMQESDYEYVRQIVRDVLEKQNTDRQKADTEHYIKQNVKRVVQKRESTTNSMDANKKEGTVPTGLSEVSEEAGNVARSLIAATLSEFRSC